MRISFFRVIFVVLFASYTRIGTEKTRGEKERVASPSPFACRPFRGLLCSIAFQWDNRDSQGRSICRRCVECVLPSFRRPDLSQRGWSRWRIDWLRYVTDFDDRCSTLGTLPLGTEVLGSARVMRWVLATNEIVSLDLVLDWFLDCLLDCWFADVGCCHLLVRMGLFWAPLVFLSRFQFAHVI